MSDKRPKTEAVLFTATDENGRLEFKAMECNGKYVEINLRAGFHHLEPIEVRKLRDELARWLKRIGEE